MPLTEKEKAYLAGFIDGEGCVSFAKRKIYITHKRKGKGRADRL